MYLEAKISVTIFLIFYLRYGFGINLRFTSVFIFLKMVNEEAQVFIASYVLLKTRIFIWVEKRRNSTIDPKWEDNYLYNGQLRTSRHTRTVIIFQQQFVFNIEINGSVQLFQKIENIVRSSDDSKWQACMRDRSWQAGHGKSWTSIHFFWRDGQGWSNARHSW